MNLERYYTALQKIDYAKKSDNQVNLILNLLRDNVQFGLVRFNDGELAGITNIGALVARGDQVVNKSLHDNLKRAIQHEQEHYYIGLPCPICFSGYSKLALKLVKQPIKYHLNAVALTNRNWAKFVIEFPKVVHKKKIIWISGNDQKLSFLKLIGLNIIQHIKIQNKNSWQYYNQLIQHNILNGDIIIISLGPTARVYVHKMFNKYPNKTFIDIGSTFDPFTRNIWHKCHMGWLETNFNRTKKCNICN